MVERSIEVLDVGRITGSSIRVYMSGSSKLLVSMGSDIRIAIEDNGEKRQDIPKNSSGISPKSSSA